MGPEIFPSENALVKAALARLVKGGTGTQRFEPLPPESVIKLLASR